MFGQDRDKTRQYFLNVWQRRNEANREPLEKQILEVLVWHPEYQPILESGDTALAAEFPPELGQSNPFLHMGLHLALREQVSTDRPIGITDCYQRLILTGDNPHAVEHEMMEHLMEALWQSQQHGQQPDEQAYLLSIQQLVNQRKQA